MSDININQIASQIGTRATKTLDNVEGNGKNIANWVSNATNCLISTPKNIFYVINGNSLTIQAGSKAYYPDGLENSTRKFTEIRANSDVNLILPNTSTQDELLIYANENFTSLGYRPIANCQSGTTDPAASSGINYYNTNTNTLTAYNSSSTSSRMCLPIMNVKAEAGVITKVHEVFDWYSYNGNVLCTFPGITGAEPNGLNPDNSLNNILRTTTTVRFVNIAEYTNYNCFAAINFTNDTDIIYHENYRISDNAPSGNYMMWMDTRNNILNTKATGDYSKIHGFTILSFDRINGKISNVHPKKVYQPIDFNEADCVVSFQRPTSSNNYTWYRLYKSGWVEQGGYKNTSNVTTINLPIAMSDTNYTINATSCDAVENKTTISPKVSTASGSITVSSFKISQSYNSDTYYNGRLYWEVKGFSSK